MQSLNSLLDAVRDRAGSDRKAAPMIGVQQQTVSAYRRGHAFPDDDKARRIAELLQLDPAYVAAVIHAERAKNAETRAMWGRVAEKFKDAAVVAALALGAASFGMPPPAQAGISHNFNLGTNGPNYTLRNNRRWRSVEGALAAMAAWLVGR